MPGEEDIRIKLIDLFIEGSKIRIDKMEELIEEKKYSEVADEAHTQKSSSHTIGPIYVTKLCEKIEKHSSNLSPS